MKITIIGAGISGLLNAYYLVKAGYEVEIFEQSNDAGGLIKTKQTEYGPMDYAASSLVNSSVFEALFDGIGLELANKSSLAKVKNIYRGSMKRWPLGMLESLRFAVGILALMISKDKGLNKERTIDDWGNAHLGKAGYRYLLETFLQGVYAGDGKKMSAPLILGSIFNRKKSKNKKTKPKIRGSVMPINGMEELIDKLVAYLEKNYVKINYSSLIDAKDIDTRQPTIIATSAPAAGKILNEMGIKAGRKLESIEMLNLASVHLVFNEEKPLFNGFGCLFPVSEGFNSLGILAGQNAFPNEYSKPVERWIIGGAHNNDILSLDDEAIIQLALADRKKLTKEQLEPINSYVLRRPQSLPHYTAELKQILDNLTLPPNLFLAGNYLGGIGLSAIMKQSKTMAERISKTT